jgi:hypothetical protein
MTVKINVTIGLGSELRWEQVDFKTATLHVRRVKRGTPSTHPVLGDELCALPRLQREQDARSPFVFTSERRAPFSAAVGRVNSSCCSIQ